MEKLLPIQYPRTWTETVKILANLEERLKKIGQMPNSHRRSKLLLQVVYDINNFQKMASKKTKDAKEDLHKVSSFVDKVKESLKYNFHQRNLKAIEEFMAKRKIPKTP